MTDDAVDTMFTRLTANFHPIGKDRLTILLNEAGYGAPVRFVQALGYCGYLARRN